MAFWRTAKVAIAPDLLGIVALFLRFSGDLSPIYGLYRGILEFKDPSSLLFIMLVTPLFLPVVIFCWRTLRVRSNRLRALEISLAYFFSTVAMLLVPTWVVLDCLVKNECILLRKEFLEVSVFAALAAGSLLLLLFNYWHGVSSQLKAEAFLIGGYLPHAAFLLIAFFGNGSLARM